MRLRKIAFLLPLLAVLSAGLTPLSAATCTSSTGCADCTGMLSGMPKCEFVKNDASCTCDLYVFGGTPACGVDGDCDYVPAGGGGGSGGGGGGGTTCTRLAGQWCPAECSSCETVYWY